MASMRRIVNAWICLINTWPIFSHRRHRLLQSEPLLVAHVTLHIIAAKAVTAYIITHVEAHKLFVLGLSYRVVSIRI